jgi:rhodanese-related sulfurtransferase
MKMTRLANAIEPMTNFFDFGIYIESIKNSRKLKTEIGLKEFYKNLLFGQGYKQISPLKLIEKLKREDNPVLMVDIRDSEKFNAGHIKGAVSSPFDDFLKQVLVDGKYDDLHHKEIVLVCDTGHMSRVAGSILAEEGFKSVYSLRNGMRRWNNWQKLVSGFDNHKYIKPICRKYCAAK